MTTELAPLTRPVVPTHHVHPQIASKVCQSEILAEAEAAIAANDIVILGMQQNPHPAKARKLLDSAKIPYKYLEWGSYFSIWKPRLQLKMWSGWPTFPMIFVKGVLIGGASDLKRIHESGGLETLLQAGRK